MTGDRASPGAGSPLNGGARFFVTEYSPTLGIELPAHAHERIEIALAMIEVAR